MKNKIKTLLASLLILQLSSCTTSYQSKAGTLEDICGTYMLTTYTKKNENNEKYDYKSQIGAEAYFTIDENGYGYYAYKDNSTALTLTSIYSIINPDDEDTSLYDSVDMYDGVSSSYLWEKKVGGFDEPTMGFNVNSKTLSYTISYSAPTRFVQHTIEYQYVCYTKISTDTSLTEINNRLSSSYTEGVPFEAKRITGLLLGGFNTSSDLEYPNPESDKYDYVILDGDSYNNGKYKLYYALKDDHKKTMVDVDLVVENGYGKFKNATINILGNKYICNNYSDYLGTGLSYEVFSEPDEAGTRYQYYNNYFSKYLGETDVDSLIATLTAK